MEEQEKENLNSEMEENENTNSDNGEEETNEETSDDTSEQEEKEEYTEREKQLYARLKKAEADLKKKADKPAENKEEAATDNLSPADLLALTKANIETEDLDEVLDYAKYKNVPIHKALESSILKATLAEKAEQRKSASAVHTGSSRRADSKLTDDRLLADARAGKMPENEADIARLMKLRFEQRK